jgi:DUF4097 and DUF4098 domain-containing protein YvlB
MSNSHSGVRNCCWIAICALGSLVVPWSLVHAGRPIQEHRAADPQGEIEIVIVTGKVEVDAWDRSEIEVSGTAGDNVERVDVTGAGNHSSIRVLPRSSHGWGSDDEAHLVIHVPAKSAVTATLVGADLNITGVLGDVKLQSVSGNLSGDTGGGVRAATVSGDVKLTARAARAIEIRTISGDIQLTGGGGEVDVTTVSGKAAIELTEVRRGRFKSVSGDIRTALELAPDAQIEGESVSGDLSLMFAAAPAAQFDVQSFSGDIKNCFGPKAAESHYGPGSRLQFTNQDGHARVRINTKSGDVRLCVKGMSSSTQASTLSLARLRSARMVVPYAY